MNVQARHRCLIFFTLQIHPLSQKTWESLSIYDILHATILFVLNFDHSVITLGPHFLLIFWFIRNRPEMNSFEAL